MSEFKIVNSVHITKLDHSTSALGRNWPQTSENTILSPHVMYFWPKIGSKQPKRFRSETFIKLFHKWTQNPVQTCKTKKIKCLNFENLSERLFFGLKWSFLDLKGSKMGQKSIWQNLEFLNLNIQHQYIEIKRPKTQNTNLSRMQCIFDQKGQKRPKQDFLPKLSLGYFINRPKIQFKYAKLWRI